MFRDHEVSVGDSGTWRGMEQLEIKECWRTHWDVDVDLQKHLQQCSCECNHMGYGNYMDYQVYKN